MKTRGLAILALTALCLCVAALPAWAEKGDKQIQFGLVYSSPTNDLQDGMDTIEADSATGFQAAFEFMVGDRVGVEPAISTANHDVDVMTPGFPTIALGDADLRTLTVNVNFHLTPESNADFYVGPTVGYTFWGDLDSPFLGGSFAIEDDLIYGVNLGVDVPFGESAWSFAGALNWLVVEAALSDATPGDPPLDVDPLQVKVGVAYNF